MASESDTASSPSAESYTTSDDSSDISIMDNNLVSIPTTTMLLIVD